MMYAVLRVAMKPRLLGLFALMVVLVIAFVLLGGWQWDVARSAGDSAANRHLEDRPVLPIAQVMTPNQAFPANGSLQPIRARGHYDTSRQELVAGRVLNGRNGFWVLTPLVIDSTGARLPIVRGFVASARDATAPATGSKEVVVTGALAPGESPDTQTLPPGQIASINLAILINTWGGTVYNAFVFATNEQPVATVAPVQHFAPPQPGGGGFHLLNAGYALQWWAFSGFAIYVWVRLVRDERDADEVAQREFRPVADNESSADTQDPVGAHTTKEGS